MTGQGITNCFSREIVSVVEIIHGNIPKRIPKTTILLVLFNVYGYHSHGFVLCDAFRHISMGHLLSNMIALLIFGSLLEDKIGWRKFLLFYFLCLAGSKFLWVMMDGRRAIGASGAICGIMAIYLYQFQFSRIKLESTLFLLKRPVDERSIIAFWYAKNILDEFATNSRVGGWAHAGGFITGMLIGKLNKNGTRKQPINL